MTIGIGFLCNDGIVVATDTQYTRGVYKGHGPKIFPLFGSANRQDLAVVVAGAGRVAFMKRATDKIEAALATVSDPSLNEVRRIVEDTLLDFFETYIYPKPDYNKDQPWFDLILGVWTKVDGFGLFKTEDVTVNRVLEVEKNYCTIGVGFSVAEYALGLTARPGMSVENAKFITAFCIKAAKDYVDYCGKNTHIWTLRGDYRGCRIEQVIREEVSDAEQHSEELFEVLQYVLGCLDPEMAIDGEYIRNVTDWLKDRVVEFRNKEIGRRVKLREEKEKQEAFLAKSRAKKITPPAS